MRAESNERLQDLIQELIKETAKFVYERSESGTFSTNLNSVTLQVIEHIIKLTIGAQEYASKQTVDQE